METNNLTKPPFRERTPTDEEVLISSLRDKNAALQLKGEESQKQIIRLSALSGLLAVLCVVLFLAHRERPQETDSSGTDALFELMDGAGPVSDADASFTEPGPEEPLSRLLCPIGQRTRSSEPPSVTPDSRFVLTHGHFCSTSSHLVESALWVPPLSIRVRATLVFSSEIPSYLDPPQRTTFHWPSH